MASTNSPSVQWVAGESAGKSVSGGTAALPVDITPTRVTTSAAAPTVAPTNGNPFVYTIPASGLYSWDGGVWRGPN